MSGWGYHPQVLLAVVAAHATLPPIARPAKSPTRRLRKLNRFNMVPRLSLWHPRRERTPFGRQRHARSISHTLYMHFVEELLCSTTRYLGTAPKPSNDAHPAGSNVRLQPERRIVDAVRTDA